MACHALAPGLHIFLYPLAMPLGQADVTRLLFLLLMPVPPSDDQKSRGRQGRSDGTSEQQDPVDMLSRVGDPDIPPRGSSGRVSPE